MSSILDALKKSDQNRPNGESNTVNNIRFSDTEKQPRSRKGFYSLVIALLAVAGGLWAHQQGWMDPVYHQFQSWVSTSNSATETDTNQTQDVVKKQPDSAVDPKTVAKPQPSPGLQPPKPGLIKQQVAEKKEVAQAPIESKPAETLTLTQEPSAEAEPKQTPSLTLESGSAEPSKPAEQSQKATPKPTKPRAVTQQSYLLLHQLPFAVRKNMPTLKMNIHMYDPTPANRMVILNGQRFNIGDDIEGVATIKDIVPEGVVIESGETVFLLPK